MGELEVANGAIHCSCCRENATAQESRETVWLDPVDLVQCLDSVTPVLLLAGTADTLCPPASMEALFAAVATSKNKELVWLKGLGHNQVSGHPDYWDAMEQFLRNVSERTRSGEWGAGARFQ